MVIGAVNFSHVTANTPTRKSSPNLQDNQKEGEIDMSKQKVAIIGGGVSGVYTAWRLLCDKPDEYDVTVYEATAHIGGRLLSVMPGDLLKGEYTGDLRDESHCELGGMRIPEGFDNYVKSILPELKKQMKSRDINREYAFKLAKFPTNDPENWHYLRGFVQTTKDLGNDKKSKYGKYKNGGVPYQLNESEIRAIKKKGLGGPIYEALTGGEHPIIDKHKIPGPGSDTNIFEFVFYALKQSVDVSGTDKPLYEFGFSDLINSAGGYQEPYGWNLSNEYWRLFSDAGGYDTVPAAWNAAAAASIILADFGGSSTYKILKSGYRVLPQALADLVQSLGGNIKTDSLVNSISLGDNGDPVTFRTGDDDSIESCDKLVLAMPPRAIQLLLNRSTDFTQRCGTESRRNLGNATPIPLLKIYLIYQLDENGTSWWEGVVGNIEQYTRLTTDLPLRQIYNFGNYKDDSGAQYAVLQISYDDGLNPGYWAGLIPEIDGINVSSNIFGGLQWTGGVSDLKAVSPLIMSLAEYQTTDELMGASPIFATAHQQFIELVNKVSDFNEEGVASPTLPVAGAAMDWAINPFGGGVNFWNVGVDVNTVYWEMMQPFGSAGDDLPIYVVGEGYSVFQGWVEGALWTAEAVLEGKFGLSAPSWAPFSVARPQ